MKHRHGVVRVGSAPRSTAPNGHREAIARRFAAMTCFGANAVVLVMSRVPLTFGAAHATGHGARTYLCAQEIEVLFGLSRHDLPRGLADDGAIQAEPDALD